MDWLSFAAGAAVAAILWGGAAALRRRRLEELTRAAERLARGEHEARVPPGKPDALGRLASLMNLLAERFAHDLAELKRLEQLRKDFVANVSHELRTPLASIKAFAETLGSSDLSKEQHAEFVREIEDSADRMTALVDDLLSLSALESGRMPPKFEPLDALPAAAEVVAALKPLAAKKDIVLRVEPFGDLPKIRADRAQLKQILTNLIDNALKFTPEKGTVRVSAAAAAGRVTLSVHDTGVGIPAADLPRVFERFYRVDKSRERERGGTGLGLSIVKHIAELHGGSVSVESEPGRGSVFRVSFPTM